MEKVERALGTGAEQRIGRTGMRRRDFITLRTAGA
eukprot:IDg21557t1